MQEISAFFTPNLLSVIEIILTHSRGSNQDITIYERGIALEWQNETTQSIALCEMKSMTSPVRAEECPCRVE